MNPTSPAVPADAPARFDYEAHPKRVNLGCGFDRREGYLNVDFQVFHEPDLVADVRDLRMLPDGYYEEVVAQDVLEHLPRTEVLPALKEWSRLLMSGGRLILRVPDVLGLAKLLAARPTLDEHEILLQNLYGTQAYTGDFHSFGFTEVVLRHYLAMARFEIVELVHRDEWLFDATAVRVEGEPRIDLNELRFMSLHPPQSEVGDPPEHDDRHEMARRALAAAEAMTDPGAIDLSNTRFRLAKSGLLRLLRLTTSRQAGHNRAVQEAIRALLSKS